MKKSHTYSVWLSSLLMIACGAPQTGQFHGKISGAAAVVVTTDYRSGSYAVISMDHEELERGYGSIHQDAVCRYSPITKKMYLVQRLGSDAVAVLDPAQGYSMETEFSVGQGTNAQDIAVASAYRAYVPRYSSPSMLVVDPSSGKDIGEVDLSPWADSDGLAEPGWSLEHDGKIFLAIQRLKDFMPDDYSSILVLDSKTGKVLGETHLTGKDPFSKLRYSAGADAIVIGEVGLLGSADGGVELLDPVDYSLSGFVISEQDLGGDIIDVVIASAKKGFVIVAETKDDLSSSTRVVSFDPSTGEIINELAASEDFDHSFLELNPSRTELWLAQRKRTEPGIRIFDTATDEELTEKPIDVGLPPFMICFTDL